MVTGRSGSNELEGRVFVSSDGGQKWTDRGATDFEATEITSFLYIDPDHPDVFYFGGLDLQKTTDTGVTWTNLTTNYRIRGRFNPGEAKTHVDMESMAFSPVDSSKLFIGTDGGLLQEPFDTNDLLVVPAALHWLPSLTVVAATVLAVESLVFIWVHVKYREVGSIVMSGVLGLLMAFVAYGRLVLQPLT